MQKTAGGLGWTLHRFADIWLSLQEYVNVSVFIRRDNGFFAKHISHPAKSRNFKGSERKKGIPQVL
ncbi:MULTISPECIES: hypothetical protein [Paenibacillus]|uniref:Uncharacterized protein n=1 Tax=Paenibacillus albilobatus TaxID=2716884 RepID=A0A920CFK1_9BACL|nr:MULTISPECIES: hypothetical protein [Paenibacillus]GIO34782.1 hypothetical protein J2TS6_59230 [Paenibacillus albilobatus]